MILQGTVVRDEITASLKKAFLELPRPVTLVIIQVGNRPDSTQYIEQKKKMAHDLGVHVQHVLFPDSLSTENLIDTLRKHNSDPAVQGVIVQLPLPEHMSVSDIIAAIDSTKDVDGLTPENARLLEEGNPEAIMPATARGVLSLLDYYQIPVEGKNITVIGRSRLVGTPIARALVNRGAHVTVCHRGTPDIPSITRLSDMIVSAAGTPRLITRDYVSPGQVIIDVGINMVTGEHLEEEVEQKTFVGDVDFEAVKEVVDAVSPVPGGVGPMTVVSLFQNLFDISKRV